ncbi:MAG: sirohydrochlorin cobaltochelatase [Eubacteriales bacterium]|nr:sirohydrochlorin cobaltochelatase [Eubacteriales bacterium]
MNHKGILVVSFGTSFPETRRKTIDAIEADLRTAFADRAFYQAFSSTFIVRKLRERNMPVPYVTEALDRALAEGITDLLVQPTYLLHAQEMEKLQETLETYRGRFEMIRVGKTLLAEDRDLQEIAACLPQMYPMTEKKENVLVLMGHGTAHSYNNIYQKIDVLLAEKEPHILIGTVEAKPDLEDVLRQIREIASKQTVAHVYLAPFLVVAGDHAVHDMASEEEDSWQSRITAAGFETSSILKGLGEFSEIRNMYIRHAKEALD